MQDFDWDLNKDLRTKYIQLSLSNTYNYITKFSLQGTGLTMQCGYNTRNKLRWVVLYDRDGDIVLPQTFLKFKKRCELNFNAELNNLDYYVTLKPKDHTKNFPEDYDYADWGDDFDMCFVGFSYQLRERLDNNLRKIKLGN